MKNLLLIPSLALGFGLAGNALAETPVTDGSINPSTSEIGTHKKVSLVETSDFYQGDFLSSSKASLYGLTQNDLYSGQGAAEAPSVRWVT